jgi:hypothetical protein
MQENDKNVVPNVVPIVFFRNFEENQRKWLLQK